MAVGYQLSTTNYQLIGKPCLPSYRGRFRSPMGRMAIPLGVANTKPPTCVHKTPDLCLLPVGYEHADPTGIGVLPLRVPPMPLLTTDLCIWANAYFALPSSTIRLSMSATYALAKAQK